MREILLNPISYQGINIICIFVILFVAGFSRISLKSIQVGMSKFLMMLIVLYSTALSCDAIRAYYDAVGWPSGNEVAGVLASFYCLSILFSSAAWLLYAINLILPSTRRNLIIYLIAALPASIMSAYSIANIFSSNDMLSAGGNSQINIRWFVVQNIVSNAYYVVAIIVAAVFMFSRDKSRREHALLTFIMPIPLLISVPVQFAFNVNVKPVGMAMSFSIFIFGRINYEQRNERKELVHFTNIMDSLKNQYSSILYANLKTNQVEPYVVATRMEDRAKQGFISSDFDSSMAGYVKDVVYSSDKDMFEEKIKRDRIIREFEKNSKYSFDYRIAVDGEIRHMSVDCWRAKNDVDITHVVIGFCDITERKQKEDKEEKSNSMIDGLVKGFEYVCFVNYANGEFEEYHVSKNFEYFFNVIGATEDIGVKRFAYIFKHGMEKDDYERFKEQFNQDVIQEALIEEGSYTLECRINLGNGPKYYNIKAIGDKSNPEEVLFGISDIDQMVRAELEKEERIKEKEYSVQLEKTITERTAELHEKAMILNQINEEITELLGNITEARDMESGEHIRRVKGFTKILADHIKVDFPEYGLDDDQIALITSASAIHDIGKIMIPDSILRKPGRFTPEEFSVMKTHCEKGCEMLEKAPKGWDKRYLDFSMEICKCHHEKWDGKGYPEGLVGDEIPISAQIVSLADCFDALTTKRVYKDAYTPQEAFDMIVNGECGVFSDKIIQSFVNAKEEFFSHMNDIASVGITPKLVNTSALTGIKILLVEDNELTRDITNTILSDEGAEVTTAICGKEVIECISAKEVIDFDAILMDLNLPDTDGFELTKQIREMNIVRAKEVPIIAVSASTDKLDKQRAFNAGMNAYVPKPVSVSNITKTLLVSMRHEQKYLKDKLDEAIMRANKDPLTGVKNMTAYTEAVGELTGKIAEHEAIEFAIVMCDVNKLKNVNDSFGHDMGDKYIRNCCKLICTTYSHSPVYRIGGDEFAIILTGEDYSNRNMLIDDLGDRVAKAMNIARIEDGRASMAVGMSVYNAYNDVSVASVAKRADESMYNNKRMMEFGGEY